MTPDAAHVPQATASAPPPAPASDPGNSDDAAQKHAIARAVWTDLLWLMPRDRTVTVTVRDGSVAVDLGPTEPDPATSIHV